MNCRRLGSSVHGISRARILEWVSHSFLQGIFPTQGSNPHLLIAGRFFILWATREHYTHIKRVWRCAHVHRYTQYAVLSRGSWSWPWHFSPVKTGLHLPALSTGFGPHTSKKMSSQSPQSEYVSGTMSPGVQALRPQEINTVTTNTRAEFWFCRRKHDSYPWKNALGHFRQVDFTKFWKGYVKV